MLATITMQTCGKALSLARTTLVLNDTWERPVESLSQERRAEESYIQSMLGSGSVAPLSLQELSNFAKQDRYAAVAHGPNTIESRDESE